LNAISIQKLTKKFKDMTAVNGLSLDIGEGELFSLLGVNGAGKTTTIKMLACLIRPTSGDAVLLGDSILTNPAGVKGKINISPQETAIAGNLTVKENLELIARVYSADKAQASDKAREMSEKLGLSEVYEKSARKLSGGMQRRLSIAMALISDPRILFLDEPTLGLDVLARRELWDLISALKGKVTIILTTHYMEESEALSDRVGVMAKGSLIAVGTVGQLCERTSASSLEEAFVSLAGGVA